MLRLKRQKHIICCGPVGGLRCEVGSGTKEIHWLYVVMFQPTISFASLLRWPRFQIASTKKKLSNVQRLACLGITGAL
jgi:hypothetical protein